MSKKKKKGEKETKQTNNIKKKMKSINPQKFCAAHQVQWKNQ